MGSPRMSDPSSSLWTMDLLPVCAEPLKLSRSEITTLQARPGPVHEIEPVVECELQAGHPGPHVALGQAYAAEPELWLRWLPGDCRTMFEKTDSEYCDAEGPDPDNRDDLEGCLLPAGHPGAHSFRLEANGGPSPSAEMQQGLDKACRQAAEDRLPSQVTDEPWVGADAPSAVGSERCGKWLVYTQPEEIDERWLGIKTSTRAGTLGISAKAATANPSPLATSRAKLICVYTADYEDKGDVRRVLRALRQDHGIHWRLSYKTDEATEAGVYGRGSAIYVSQPGSLDFEDRRKKPPQQGLF